MSPVNNTAANHLTGLRRCFSVELVVEVWYRSVMS